MSARADGELRAFPKNRSVPDGVVIPVLSYGDVHAAADWLCRAFGFRKRIVIGDHRVQLTVEGGGGGVVVAEGPAAGPSETPCGHRVMVRVADARQHAARAEHHGARIVSPPTDYPYGERQYSAEDFAGNRWTFSQTIADADPASWGGVLVE